MLGRPGRDPEVADLRLVVVGASAVVEEGGPGCTVPPRCNPLGPGRRPPGPSLVARTLPAADQTLDGGHRDRHPVGTVACLVDDLVERLVQLERVEEAAQVGVAEVLTARLGVAAQELLARGAGPRRPTGGRCRPLLQVGGRRGVVEGAQHPRDVAQGKVGGGALLERAHRLALEVDQHPAAARHVEHLPEVEVAVDPLQRGQIEPLDAGVDGLDVLAVGLELGHLGVGSLGAAAHPVDERGAGGSVRGAGGERLAQRGVDLGGGGAEAAGTFAEVLLRPGRLQGGPPGVLGVGEVLLHEREVTTGLGAVGERPAPFHIPDRSGDHAVAERRDGAGDGDVRVVAALEDAEDLDDDRPGLAVRLDHDRGVGLLAGEDARGAQRGRLTAGDHPARAGGGDVVLGVDVLQQDLGEDRVVRRVVDVAGAQLVVLGHGHERVGHEVDRLGAVGERHLVDDLLGTGPVEQEVVLETDLAERVLPADGAEEGQAGGPARAAVPALPGDPLRQEVAERGGEGCHQESSSRGVRPSQ